MRERSRWDEYVEDAREPQSLGTVLGMVAVLALVFYAYLGAVVNPEENLKDLPIALVNEDGGGEIAAENVNIGDRVVEKVTGPDSPEAGTVGWIRPDTRAEALDGIGDDEYYGAVVIPGNYTERISLRHRQPADDTHRRGGRGSGRRDERPACEAW